MKFSTSLALAGLAVLTATCSNHGAAPPAVATCPAGGGTPPDALLAVSGDALQVALLNAARATPGASKDSLRSGVNYFRHGQHALDAYLGHAHKSTRAIDVNWALESSACVDAADCANRGQAAGSGFDSLLTQGGARTAPLYHEIPAQSENIITYFTRTPRWLSSCAARNPGNPALCDQPAPCGYIGTYYYQLYPPNDWTAWTQIVSHTVDVLLDLTEVNGAPRTVYLEAWNEPNVLNCSWNDTHANFLDYYRRTSIAFSTARDTLCAAKGYSAARCARLKFGGPAVGTWDGRIDSARTTSLSEDLVAYALIQAQSDSAVRLDFVSFHGFWPAAPAPSETLAVAKAAYTKAYQDHAGATPPFPPPEIVMSEWNADDANRAGALHPAIMAETYWGLLANDLRHATISSLDAYDANATLASPDYGLLLGDAVTTHYQRPAFFVYTGMRDFAERTDSVAFAADGSTRLILSQPTVVNGARCYDAVLWDYAPDPITAALAYLLDPARCGPAALTAAYASAVPQGSVPALCQTLSQGSQNPQATQALCQDAVRGTCTNIPTPTPAGGHACDATWAGYFAQAGARYAALTHDQSTPLDVTFDGLDGSAAVAAFNGVAVAEDHQDPTPRAVTALQCQDGRSLRFTLNRNAVAFLHDICVR